MTAATKRCKRFRAVALAEVVPIAAPVAVAAIAWVPCAGGGSGGVDEAVWRTTAGWFAAEWPAEGVTGAEDGAAEGGRGALRGDGGVKVVVTGGRRSEP